MGRPNRQELSASEAKDCRTSQPDGVVVAPYEPRHLAGCEAILAALPEWFGIPEANAAYLRELSVYDSWVALDRETPVGAVTLRWHNRRSTEIHFIAVHPAHHRRGIGRLLIDHCEAESRSRGAELLHVKTLGESRPCEHYARTREFYLALGFVPLLETTAFWGERNPTLVMVKGLRGAAAPREQESGRAGEQ